MFNKIKHIASNLGNKKQRENFKKEVAKEEDFAIKLTKLELTERMTITPFIRNSTDNDEYPNYFLRQALHRGTVMTKEEEEQKISWLRKRNIKTILGGTLNDGKAYSTYFKDIRGQNPDVKVFTGKGVNKEVAEEVAKKSI